MISNILINEIHDVYYISKNTLRNSFDNPIGISCNGSADPGEGPVGTLVTPRDDTDNDIISCAVVVQGTSGVALACIFATVSEDTSANHILGDNSGLWQL